MAMVVTSVASSTRMSSQPVTVPGRAVVCSRLASSQGSSCVLQAATMRPSAAPHPASDQPLRQVVREEIHPAGAEGQPDRRFPLPTCLAHEQ